MLILPKIILSEKQLKLSVQMELWHCQDYIPYLVVLVLNLYLCISDTI